MDLTNFVLHGNNRLEAYAHYMDFEMGFEDPNVRDLMSYYDFCQELDKGYGKSSCPEIARLYEDKDGKVWYDKEY